ncbi:hypothetical protein [Rhizobium sp. Root708]|nr:hypothetical protein [Rhizobium sp. Root708]
MNDDNNEIFPREMNERGIKRPNLLKMRGAGIAGFTAIPAMNNHLLRLK